MRDEIARLVHPVLDRGLELRQRLLRGERPVLYAEQAILKGLLLTEEEAQRLVDFGGEPEVRPVNRARTTSDVGVQETDPQFLGVRYALVCWLDEVFVLDSPWESQWNERKLEGALYGTNDRAWQFWEQARRAESRPGTDALEVFYLCVMLGFRGELREDPEKLGAWIAGTRGRLARPPEWTPPPSADPPTDVPLLRGRQSLQRMVFLGGLVLLLVIPVLAFFLVQQLGR
jgi:type VI secretion system protein ImpK